MNGIPVVISFGIGKHGDVSRFAKRLAGQRARIRNIILILNLQRQKILPCNLTDTESLQNHMDLKLVV